MHVLIDRFRSELWLVLERPYSLLPGMGRNRDLNDGHIVVVVRFRQLMTQTVAVHVRTWFAGLRHESRVYRDADNVVSRRHWRLVVATIQHKILTSEFPHVRVRPADADSLVARNGRFTSCRGRRAA